MTCKNQLQWELLQFSALTSLCTSAIFCHNQNKSVRNIGQSLDFICGRFSLRSFLENPSAFGLLRKELSSARQIVSQQKGAPSLLINTPVSLLLEDSVDPD